MKKFVLLVALAIAGAPNLKAQGMPVYDNTNFLALGQQLFESAKQTSELLKTVKFLKEQKERIEEVSSIVKQLKTVREIIENNQRLYETVQGDLREILNSPYIRTDEVDSISESFNSLIENALEDLGFMQDLLTSNYLNMTDAERLEILETQRLRSIMDLGLEYIDAVFTTIKGTDFSQYTIAGMKALAVLLFLVNIIKKYNEGAVYNDGYTWGLSPAELIKNFMIVLLVIFSTQILNVFDGILVGIESNFLDTAPALVPLQLQDVEVEQDMGLVEAGSKALGMLYEYLVTPFYPMKVVAFIIGIFLWIMDLFIYPLFLAERFFLLGLMQVFFPLVISMAVFERFREMGYRFFKLYAAVYMIVPAFFLVNIFINQLYEAINTDFWPNLVGDEVDGSILAPVIQLGSLCFIVLLKFKLYQRAITFTFRIFSS